MRVDKSARSGGIIRISLGFCNIKVCCVFSLESPHWGDSNEYTQYTVFNIKKKITLNNPESAAMGYFQGTQEWVRNSRGKQAISVRVIEVLLYLLLCLNVLMVAPVSRLPRTREAWLSSSLMIRQPYNRAILQLWMFKTRENFKLSKSPHHLMCRTVLF